MAKVSTNISLDPNLKENAVKLFSNFGLDLSTAITLFLQQSVREQKIPFEIKAEPDWETMSELEAFREIRKMAESGRLPDLTLDEINEEIRKTKREGIV